MNNNFNLKKLYKCPEYRIVSEEKNIKAIFYQNEKYKEKQTEVFAYLGVPENVAEPVPAMICIHGGGGKAFKEWVELWSAKGYAAIAMDLASKGPNGENHATSGPGQEHKNKFDQAPDWNNIWTNHAVCAVIRAHSIIRSIPGVDPERTGITGISWGGYLTCCVSGIDKRFKFAVPVYGCGFLQDNSAVDWLQIFKEMTPENRKWWRENCDPSVYLENTEMPLLFVTGTNDFAYPLDSLRKSCLVPKGNVRTCIRLEMPHGHVAGWTPKEIELYADSMLKGAIPLPSIGMITHKGNKVCAEYSSELPVKAYLLYTCANGVWQERKWVQIEAPVKNGKVTAELPQGATAYLLAVEDTRGAYISTIPEVAEYRKSRI
jgi:dienelactone hydrolase